MIVMMLMMESMKMMGKMQIHYDYCNDGNYRNDGNDRTFEIMGWWNEEYEWTLLTLLTLVILLTLLNLLI